MAVKDLDFSHYYTYQESKFSFDQPALQQKARQFEEYERLADCPISSGIELNEYSDDKLHTRLLAVGRKIAVPTTLAFGFSLEKYHHHPVSSQVKSIDLSKNLSVEEIQTYLRDFPFDKFVIKPSDARWMGGRVCTLELTFEAHKFSYRVAVFAINCLKDIQSIPLISI